MAFKTLPLTLLLCILLSFNSICEAVSQPTNKTVLKYGISPSATMIPWDEDLETGEPGIFLEVVSLLLSEANITGEPKYLPVKRAINALEQGVIDFDFVNPDWFPEGNVGPMFVTSIPVLNFTELFVTLPENSARFNDIQKVYGNVVGTIRGFYYSDHDKFTRMDFDSQRALLEGLKRGRFEVAILEEMTALYWSRKTSINVAMSAIYIDGKMVLRLHKSKAHLLPALNNAITKLQKQKKVRDVFERYRSLYRFEQK